MFSTSRVVAPEQATNWKLAGAWLLAHNLGYACGLRRHEPLPLS
ncbi:hypothetical protein [Micromonospora sp. NPDC051141]